MASFEPDAIRVLVKFDGHEEVCFFDTGSPFTIVGQNAFFSKYKKQTVLPMVSAANRLSSKYEIKIKKISLGKNVRSNQSIFLAESEVLSPVFGKCILGLDLLKDNVISLDFKTKKLCLVDKIPEDKKSYDLSFNKQGHLLMPLKIKDKEVLAIWDTGMSGVALAPSLIDAHKSAFNFIKSFDSGTDGSGNPLSYKIYKTDHVSILDLKGPQGMPVAAIDMSGGIFKDLDTNAFIGFQMITQYNWMVDIKRKRWAVWDY